MMPLLIVNADDYGLSPAVSQGIREAHQRGIVTSTTVMIGVEGAAEAVAFAQRETPSLGLGLHLTLAGKAITPVLPPQHIPTLVRHDGLFYDEPGWSERQQQFDPGEVEAELRAQFDRFLAAAGRSPTHLDSHYHAVYRQHAGLAVMTALAREHGLPVRNPGKKVFTLGPPSGIPYPEHFISIEKGLTPDTLAARLQHAASASAVELMCHPGYVDDALISRDSMTVERTAEIALLANPHVRAAVSSAGFTLATFAAVRL